MICHYSSIKLYELKYGVRVKNIKNCILMCFQNKNNDKYDIPKETRESD